MGRRTGEGIIHSEVRNPLIGKCLLAIPVHNEQECLPDVLDSLAGLDVDVLIVDDGSTDRTGLIVDQMEGISLIRHLHNLGYGRSLADSFDYAIQHGYQWLVTMDGDGQHESEAMDLFGRAMDRGDADIISGSRYLTLSSGDDAPPPERQRVNRRITAMINRRLGLNLTDAFCGYKAYRVSGLTRLNITEPGYAMPMQLWVQAVHAGLRIQEVPVRLIYNDPNRSFGGQLDDADIRFAHYVDVFEREIVARYGESGIHDAAHDAFNCTDESCMVCCVSGTR